MKSKIIFGLVFGLVLMSGTAILSFSQTEEFSESTTVTVSSSTNTELPPEKPTTILVDWVTYDRQGLVDASSDIIVGKIISVNPDYLIKSPLPVVSSDIEIMDVIKGNLTINSIITQKQIAGIASDQHKISDQHIGQKNETYLFFLKYKSPEDVYVTVGGPQGKLMIDDSKIYSLDNFENGLYWMKFKINSNSSENFLNDLSISIEEEMSK